MLYSRIYLVSVSVSAQNQSASFPEPGTARAGPHSIDPLNPAYASVHHLPGLFIRQICTTDEFEFSFVTQPTWKSYKTRTKKSGIIPATTARLMAVYPELIILIHLQPVVRRLGMMSSSTTTTITICGDHEILHVWNFVDSGH